MSLPIAGGGANQGLLAPILPVWRSAQAFVAQPAVRRAGPAIGALAVVLAGVAIWLLLRQPVMLPLYPGLAEAEKAQAVQILATAGLRAEVDAASGTLHVAEGDYQRAKMALAAEGVPVSAPDAETVLGRIQLGSSRPVEAMRLKQAQEMALAGSITTIDGIASARVHLALPERSAFIRDTQPPRASVVVALHPGHVLGAGQVEAIINLVAASVGGLSRDMVSVIDHRGRLLSQPEGDAVAALGSRQMQTRRQMEDLYRTRIEALLVPLTGTGNLSVQVTMDMDFTSSEIHADAIIPGASAVRSEEIASSESGASLARGIPGRVSNTPPAVAETVPADAATAQGAEGGAVGQVSQTASTKRNYEIGRRVEITRPGAPRIDRISVAVLIRASDDAAALPLADIERLVKGAIGFDGGRGDTITLLAQPFIEPDFPAMVAAPPQAGARWLVPVVAGVGGTLLLAAILLMALRGRKRRPEASAAAPLAGVPGQPGLLAGTPAAAALPGPTEMTQGLRDERRLHLARAALNAQGRDEKQVILRTLAEEDPARMAAVLRKMMKDEIDRVI